VNFDPVTLEVCWNRLIGVVNEQAAALQRTSFTSIVREAGDLSAGVFDRRGYMLAQAVTGTPGHINSMALAMRHFLDAYPLEQVRPGDVLLTNDPWKTSGHLNDVTICTPVFRRGEPVAFFGRPVTPPTSAAISCRPRRTRSTRRASSSR
jgi:N-methylhydantoinase B